MGSRGTIRAALWSVVVGGGCHFASLVSSDLYGFISSARHDEVQALVARRQQSAVCLYRMGCDRVSVRSPHRTIRRIEINILDCVSQMRLYDCRRATGDFFLCCILYSGS